MKFFFILSIVGFCFSSKKFVQGELFHKPFTIEDTSCVHTTDGRITEWPSQKFETDPGTGIKYAVDNDTQNVYLALIVPGPQMQTKIMHNGMELYIDPRGKKKEDKGIEFPVKRDPVAENSFMVSGSDRHEESNGQETASQRKTRMKAMRAAMILTLTSMKVFGFAGDKAEEQGLVMPASANVGFAWDSSDAMCIEYKVPVSLLGGISSLARKDISIGWKSNGFQKPTDQSSSESPGEGKRRNYGGGQGSTGDRFQQDLENSARDQRFWTKYIFR